MARGAAAAASPPPSIEHAPLSCVVADRHPVIEVRVAPPESVSRARVCFRAGGTRDWYYVDLRRAADSDVFSAVLPRPSPATAAVEYYLDILGRGFASQRTAENAARVAPACDGTALPPIISAATVAVGSLERGVPALPTGFSHAGVVSLGAGGAGGGVSAGIVLGGTAVVGAGTVAVIAGGGDDACPASSARFHEIGLDCAGIQRDVRAGCALGLQVGVGRWATVAEMQQALAGHAGIIAVDGQPLPVVNEGPTMHTGGGESPGFGDRARATWIATAGDHVITGFWTVHPGGVSRCTFTVSD